LQSSGIQITAATEKADDEIYTVDFSQPTAIILGSEEKGISPSILNVVDHKAKLPLHGHIGSLNVSVACGVFLYEVVRQRRS
jgi:23S rRNA (guanosine2251-2'-O)-methyltransferase